MIIPTIHMNGTSREALIEQYSVAGNTVMSAMRAMDEASPNGRDYYVQGPGAIGDAQRQHDAQVAKLREVYDYLTLMVDTIDAAGR